MRPPLIIWLFQMQIWLNLPFLMYDSEWLQPSIHCQFQKCVILIEGGGGQGESLILNVVNFFFILHSSPDKINSLICESEQFIFYYCFHNNCNTLSHNMFFSQSVDVLLTSSGTTIHCPKSLTKASYYLPANTLSSSLWGSVVSVFDCSFCAQSGWSLPVSAVLPRCLHCSANLNPFYL